jgi:hypothetical protein
MTLEFRVPLLVAEAGRGICTRLRGDLKVHKNTKHITDYQKKGNSDCRLNAKRENR